MNEIVPIWLLSGWSISVAVRIVHGALSIEIRMAPEPPKVCWPPTPTPTGTELVPVEWMV